jgi:cellulose synthase/poly-beta-1,6-N-acetylglucosamine synthase-like glycosyltransferase
VLANRWSNSSFLINISLTIATSSMYFLAAELNDNLGLVKVAFAVVPVAYLMIILSPIPREFDVESNLASDLVNAGFFTRFKGKYFFPSFLPPTGSPASFLVIVHSSRIFVIYHSLYMFTTFFLLFSMFCAMNGLIFFKPSLLDSPEDLRAKDVQLLLNTEKGARDKCRTLFNSLFGAELLGLLEYGASERPRFKPLAILRAQNIW